ncbi:helix-turn-helix domain-containing protein [Sediminibacterium ginsengisoli]|uniref:AraC-type DNA-binding protein n=1 Tax=Sediminibacterium ginsengisoli TaxID=413434 RepID=A0A1T4Q3M7_9BACT|nr:helix-turn-helix domain-containing protein [Sediminibacterium ginsengisoli]SJZ98264.1 AraC-type DNA-binding protein [Sediminibacterium ginsengisoli]
MAVKRNTAIPGIDMTDLTIKGFKAHVLTNPRDLPVSLGRRDFYKMGLVNGDMSITYGDRVIEMNGPVLFFVNPKVPHGVIHRSRERTGYACLFTPAFFIGRERTQLLNNSPLVRTSDAPHIALNNEQAEFIAGIFKKMVSVYDSDYRQKGEMISNCIELILREALRIQPPQNVPEFKKGATRITHLFFDLLERQFPLERSGQALKLRAPQDFAAGLAVHVNYLNRAVKEVTGKPTSVHIADRIVAEAKALLLHTDCSIAEIADALGFEYTTYFNNYFKRITGAAPNSFRKGKV